MPREPLGSAWMPVNGDMIVAALAIVRPRALGLATPAAIVMTTGAAVAAVFTCS